MYTVLGATGNIGSIIVKSLLEKGEKVRVVGRHAGKLQTFVQKGAEAVVADICNPEALAQTFLGSRAAFLMIPPNLNSPDYRADQERFSDALAAAVKSSALHYAVHLSSIGAQAPLGTGPIAGLHNSEIKLNTLDKLNVLHLRPAYFMENHLGSLKMIQMMGIYGGPLKADMQFPMIATHDIGIFAADRLLKLDFNGKQTQELLGQRDLSMNEVVIAMSKALYKPDLRYVQFPYEEVEKVIAQMGVPPKTAAMFIEMAEGFNSGLIAAQESRCATNSTPTSIETFLKEVFLPAYQSKAANA